MKAGVGGLVWDKEGELWGLDAVTRAEIPKGLKRQCLHAARTPAFGLSLRHDGAKWKTRPILGLFVVMDICKNVSSIRVMERYAALTTVLRRSGQLACKARVASSRIVAKGLGDVSRLAE